MGLPDSSSLHESKSALHEKNNDRHDEQEKMVDFFRNFVRQTCRLFIADVVEFVDRRVLIVLVDTFDVFDVFDVVGVEEIRNRIRAAGVEETLEKVVVEFVGLFRSNFVRQVGEISKLSRRDRHRVWKDSPVNGRVKTALK